MKLVAAKCPNCRANIDVDKNSDKTVCEYCGSKIIVEEAIATYKLEISGNVEVSNATSFSKLLKLAERLLKDDQLDQALEKYNKALELDPDDTYVDYRIAFVRFLKNKNMKDCLDYALKKIKNVKYSFIDGEKEDDVSPLYRELIDIVYNEAKKIFNSAKNNKSSSLSEIQGSLIIIYNYLAFFENFNKIIDKESKLKERVLVYILDIIYYGTYVYTYVSLGDTYKYQDKENTDALQQRKSKYYEELIAINPAYKDSLNYEVKNKNTFFYNTFHNTLHSIAKLIIGFIVFIVFVLFLALMTNS